MRLNREAVCSNKTLANKIHVVASTGMEMVRAQTIQWILNVSTYRHMQCFTRRHYVQQLNVVSSVSSYTSGIFRGQGQRRDSRLQYSNTRSISRRTRWQRSYRAFEGL